MNVQSPTHVRAVEPTDEQLLEAVTLGAAFVQESPEYRSLAPAVANMIEFAYNARANPMFFFNVAVRDNDVIGFMICERAPYGFTDKEFAFDRLLYVAQDKRGGVAARTLINAFETWCSSHNIVRIMLGVTTGLRTEQTEKLYNKLGYDTVGVVTMKET